MASKRPVRVGRRFLEHLSHFSCASCQKWWSVADAPVAKNNWYCSWCGKKGRFRTEK